MLTYSEVRQLSDRDIAEELIRSRDSLFRQKIGVRTGHLKDNHRVRQLNQHIARLLTELQQRKQIDKKVAESAPAVVKKLADDRAAMEKAQASKAKPKTAPAKAKKVAPKKKEVEPAVEKSAETSDVRVKTVEKKGVFSKFFGRK